MGRFDYYEELKQAARGLRVQYGLESAKVTRSELRRIYKDQGIRIDYWPGPLKNIRGAYFRDDIGATVMVAKGLPVEPTIFTLAHELKHHVCDDRDKAALVAAVLGKSALDIGAEVFAAELIFPEELFHCWVAQVRCGDGDLSERDIVRLKHESETTLSYTSIRKRAEWLHYIPKGSYLRTLWRKLEEQIFGPPVYKQILARRSGHP
jgi:Zn-dependent peptidase ImmA (M78 family)